MAYEIIIGRGEKDRQRFGLKGTVFLGRHYVQMGQTTSLSNDIYLDVASSHVIFVVGKRGGGKSYTMGVIAEGFADLPEEIRQNLSIILLDTMGIYWTMKYPNKEDEKILSEWNMKPKPLNPVIFTPIGFFDKFKKEGILTDLPFSIKPSELSGEDWCTTFQIDPYKPMGILIIRVINELLESGKNFDIDDILERIKADINCEKTDKEAVTNLFETAKKWGLFDVQGTQLRDLAKAGQVTVLDVSAYATMPNGWAIKSLVVGLIAQKLFLERMTERRKEEFEQVKETIHYFTEEKKVKQEYPMVWLVIDEAHEFLPREGKTLASDPLITILREGRQPGISLVLASQQPAKIHTDVMTQADTVISHRITAKIDTDALGALMQSYMREGLDVTLDKLPRVKGAALIFDDTNEKLYPFQVRPRFTWHGGSAPYAIKETEKQL